MTLVVATAVAKEALCGVLPSSPFLCLSLVSASATSPEAPWPRFNKGSRTADLAAIEKLHREDVNATLTQDPKKLIDLWAEDAVAFYPGSPPAVGKQAIEAQNEKFHAQNPGLKVLSYTSKEFSFVRGDPRIIELRRKVGLPE